MFDDNRIGIVLACDDNYAQHAAVMLRSLFSSNSETKFRVFLLVPEVFYSFARISDSIKDFPDNEISLVCLIADRI